MLTNDVYSVPAVGVAQISVRPPPSPNVDELHGKYQLKPYTVRVGRHGWFTHGDAGLTCLTVKTTNNHCSVYRYM